MYCWKQKCALCPVFVWGAKQLRCFFSTHNPLDFRFWFLAVCPCDFFHFPSPILHIMFQQIWWLDPELTYGNAKPFVFTQGHSVCNRSFFPCFDTPAVKCTYSATVKVRDQRAVNDSWSAKLLLIRDSIVTWCMYIYKILIVTVL